MTPARYSLPPYVRAALAVALTSLCACGGGPPEPRLDDRLVGWWRDPQRTGVPAGLEFFSDGTFIANRDDAGTYRVVDDRRLVLDLGPQGAHAVDYEVSEDTLRVVAYEGWDPVRKGYIRVRE